MAHDIELKDMIIELQVKNAYSKGGIPLTVLGVANIKVPGEEPLIHNALERFLGWLRGMLVGDFGMSYTQREPVAGLIAGRLGVTLPLSISV